MSKAANWNEEMMGNVRALNEVMFSNSERLLEMNLAFQRKQAEVVLAAMRAAMDLKDVNDMQAYVASQSEVAKEMVDGMVADAKAVAKLGGEAVAEVSKLVNANVAAVKKAA